LVGEVLQGKPVASARGGKEVHALDVARAVGLLVEADDQAIGGQAFNCYDRYIADQDVARLAKELSGSKSTIADQNRGPKNQIKTDKLRALGMTFGGDSLLKETVAELIAAHRKKK
jgi:nucleoside-diphosphate-sugar epimerase